MKIILLISVLLLYVTELRTNDNIQLENTKIQLIENTITLPTDKIIKIKRQVRVKETFEKTNVCNQNCLFILEKVSIDTYKLNLLGKEQLYNVSIEIYNKDLSYIKQKMITDFFINIPNFITIIDRGNEPFIICIRVDGSICKSYLIY